MKRHPSAIKNLDQLDKEVYRLRLKTKSLEEKMDDRITIIEGPPPVFEHVDDAWAMGLNEGPSFYGLALTRLRTFNGQALVERCHRAWSQKEPIFWSACTERICKGCRP